MMKLVRRGLWLALMIVLASVAAYAQSAIVLSPASKAVNVNPDTHLQITFAVPPTIGTSGKIRIYDAKDKSLVDTLDLSVPVSPNPNGRVPPPPASAGPRAADASPKASDVTVQSSTYQVDMIAGYDFHFFPIIVRGNTATIYPHHNVLKYGHSYIVKMDPSVLKAGSDGVYGFKSNTGWTFTTKAAPPPPNIARVTVAADGGGDFNTVQGAFDYIPPNNNRKVTIFIKNGTYEELVFAANKANIIVRGESRDGVVVAYPNNSAFNPPKDGPSRRPAFSLYNSTNIQLSSFTITNSFIGQAEALLISGSRNIVDHMTLNGSGDALTMRGSVYLTDSKLTGDGDTCLCYGPAFYNRVEIHSIGPFVWTRNSAETHGNVFVYSSFIAIDKPLPWTVNADGTGGTKVKPVLTRLPHNNGNNFPYAEMVLINARLDGVPPEGWGPVEDDTTNVKLFEFNSRDLQGQSIDTSKRHPVSRQLTMARDSQAIANYSKPEFVLGGWRPIVE